MLFNFIERIAKKESRVFSKEAKSRSRKFSELVDKDNIERFKNGPLNTLESIMSLYFYESFLQIIKIIGSLKELHGFNYVNVRHDGKQARMVSLWPKLDTLRDQMEVEIQNLYDHYKVYLLYAVISELKCCKSTDPDSKETFYNKKYENLLSEGDPRKCVDFLEGAINTFVDKRKFPPGAFDFGGSKWSSIAKLTAEMWRNEKADIRLLDRINNLQHNSGSIFDKNPRMFGMTFDNYIKRLLDIRFESHSLTEILDRVEISNRASKYYSPYAFKRTKFVDQVRFFSSVVVAISKWVNDPNSGYANNSEVISKVNHMKAFLGL